MAAAASTDIVERTITVSKKPKLGLHTPKTSTFPASAFQIFPSELSALSASARSPLKGFPEFIKHEPDAKTPITPPLAYLDFLKAMTPVTGTMGSFSTEKSSGPSSPTSADSSATSDHSNCSCSCDTHKHKATAISQVPATAKAPTSTSAPDSSRPNLPRVPSLSNSENSSDSPMIGTPMSATPMSATPLSAISASSAVLSPFSARSHFDWDGKSKERYSFDSVAVKSPRASTRVKHVKEVITRTVTYTTTPRMSAAPKGKRRKVE